MGDEWASSKYYDTCVSYTYIKTSLTRKAHSYMSNAHDKVWASSKFYKICSSYDINAYPNIQSPKSYI